MEELTTDNIKKLSNNELNALLAMQAGWKTLSPVSMKGIPPGSEVFRPIPTYTGSDMLLDDLVDLKITELAQQAEWKTMLGRKPISWDWHMPARKRAEKLLECLLKQCKTAYADANTERHTRR